MFYIALDGALTAVAIDPDAADFGIPSTLFDTGFRLNPFSMCNVTGGWVKGCQAFADMIDLVKRSARSILRRASTCPECVRKAARLQIQGVEETPSRQAQGS